MLFVWVFCFGSSQISDFINATWFVCRDLIFSNSLSWIKAWSSPWFVLWDWMFVSISRVYFLKEKKRPLGTFHLCYQQIILLMKTGFLFAYLYHPLYSLEPPPPKPTTQNPSQAIIENSLLFVWFFILILAKSMTSLAGCWGFVIWCSRLSLWVNGRICNFQRRKFVVDGRMEIRVEHGRKDWRKGLGSSREIL